MGTDEASETDDGVDWAAFAALSADPEIEPGVAMAGAMYDRGSEPETQQPTASNGWLYVGLLIGLVIGLAFFVSL